LGNASINAIAVDGAGNAYVTGYGTITPTAGAFQTSPGSAYVAKLNPTGTGLVYATNFDPTVQDIAVDSAGNAYVTGDGSITPTAGAFQTSPGSAYVAKLNPTGTGLVYATNLGPEGGAGGRGIAIDSAGDAYVAGQTSSAEFPTTAGAHQTTIHGQSNAFVTKLNPSGSGLAYSTYFGDDVASVTGIDIDPSGNAYIVGTGSVPTTPGAFRTQGEDAFAAKLDPAGGSLVYSTYLPTPPPERRLGPPHIAAIAVDANGDAFVTGQGYADTPTTPGALQPEWPLGPPTGFSYYTAGFLSELNPSGTGLLYGTFLAGSGDCAEPGCPLGGDAVTGVAVGPGGAVSVVGASGSTDFPTTADAFQPTNHNVAGPPDRYVVGPNAFLAQIKPGDTTPAEPLAETGRVSFYDDPLTNPSRVGSLNGFVLPNGLSTSYRFEYGPTTAYGSSTPVADAGAGNSIIHVSAVLSNLPRNTPLHVRLIAANSMGTSLGSDHVFAAGMFRPRKPSFTAGPQGVTHNRDVSFQFRSNVSDLEYVSHLQCRLDGRPYRKCTSPRSYHHLAVRRHVFRVRAVSYAGLLSPPAVRVFRVVRR
jgi:hypothetical protein